MKDGPTINDGAWHHIVAVRDASTDENILYVDGAVAAGPVIHNFEYGFGGSASLNIGHMSSNYHYNGMLDEVALYNKALSADEIRDHYNAAYYLGRDYCNICTQFVNIMPAGDSITKGSNAGEDEEAYFASYRKDLWDLLNNAGYEVDFVGTQSWGWLISDFDADNDGHGAVTDAWMAENIYNGLDDADNGLNLLNNNPPDVVLLHIGTNELEIPPIDAEEVSNILEEIDQYEAANRTTVTVILARIVKRSCCEEVTPACDECQETTDFNDTIEAMVQARINNGDKIIMVDMENIPGFDYHEDPVGHMYNNLHPYETGYAMIADQWYDKLNDFLPLCVLPITDSPPSITSNPLTGATVGEFYTYDVAATGNPVPTYTLTTFPDGMTIDLASGLIEWTPDAAGDFDVTVEASNGEIPDDIQSFTINVFDSSSCPADMTNYWKLDETGNPTSFFDSYAGTNNATCTNCPTPATGILDGAQQFDGSNDEVNVTDDGTFDWGADDSFSIELWMNSSTIVSANKVMVGRGNATALFWLGYRDKDGQPNDAQAKYILSDSSGDYINMKDGPTINDGAWHHIVAVRDASTDENILYVDGAVAAGPVIHNFDYGFGGSASLNIGHMGSNYHYNGMLDEVALYNKALSADEIISHYNVGNGAEYCSGCQSDAECDDGVDCTEDTCTNNVCQSTANNNNCDDFVDCTDDTCDVTLGCQFMTNNNNCDDSVDCTDNTCDPANDCQYTPNDNNCDDGVSCTDDTCDESLDCQFTAIDSNCDDDTLCSDAYCDDTLDCQYDPLPQDTPCDDDLFCNGEDTCDGSGTCINAGDPCKPLICDESSEQCLDVCTGDDDCDGICNPGESNPDCTGSDNCPDTPNPDQADTYPPQQNGIGDACDCEGDFNCDRNVAADDIDDFLADFGRNFQDDPCSSASPCNGDFNCDQNVAADDVHKFLEDFGRSQYFNTCPPCVVGNWCVYQ